MGSILLGHVNKGLNGWTFVMMLTSFLQKNGLIKILYSRFHKSISLLLNQLKVYQLILLINNKKN